MHAVLGFFILEDHVLNTGNGLITRAFLDEMWTMALSKIVTALQTHSVSKYYDYNIMKFNNFTKLCKNINGFKNLYF